MEEGSKRLDQRCNMRRTLFAIASFEDDGRGPAPEE